MYVEHTKVRYKKPLDRGGGNEEPGGHLPTLEFYQLQPFFLFFVFFQAYSKWGSVHVVPTQQINGGYALLLNYKNAIHIN